MSGIWWSHLDSLSGANRINPPKSFVKREAGHQAGWHAHVFVGMFGQAKAHEHAHEDVGMPPAHEGEPLGGIRRVVGDPEIALVWFVDKTIRLYCCRDGSVTRVDARPSRIIEIAGVN